MDDLFEPPSSNRPFKVELKGVKSPIDQYMVRWWLLDSGWIEFDDWMIAGHGIRTGTFEVWFKDVGKAVLFKLSLNL